MKTTKEQILTQFIGIMSVDGYAGTSMKEVAEGCGITAPALYKHYENKNDIHLCCCRHIGEQHINVTYAWFVILSFRCGMIGNLKRFGLEKHIVGCLMTVEADLLKRAKNK
jgi:AcrR family transcriptional regulator